MTGGYTVPNPSTTTLNSAETHTSVSPQQYSSSLLATLDSQLVSSPNSTTVQLYDSKGNPLNASQDPFWQNIQMNMGGSSFTFDPSTGQSTMSGSSGIALVNQAAKILDNTTVTFVGADMRILLEVNDAALPYASNLRMAKELVECTILTVSVYREKTPVRACSYINPKGGPRASTHLVHDPQPTAGHRRSVFVLPDLERLGVAGSPARAGVRDGQRGGLSGGSRHAAGRRLQGA